MSDKTLPNIPWTREDMVTDQQHVVPLSSATPLLWVCYLETLYKRTPYCLKVVFETATTTRLNLHTTDGALVHSQVLDTPGEARYLNMWYDKALQAAHEHEKSCNAPQALPRTEP